MPYTAAMNIVASQFAAARPRTASQQSPGGASDKRK